jgi:PAS domain S-box-containing protein
MSADDLAPFAPTSSRLDAEAILRELSASAAASAWSELSCDDAESILRCLASGVSLEARGPDMTKATAAETAVEDFPPGCAPELSETAFVLPRLSEKTLLNVLETAPDAIVVIDQRGTIVLVNAQTEKMFGYERRELLGKKLEILVPLRNRGRHVQQRREFVQAPRVRAMGSGLPLFGLRKDGREFPVEISLSPLETRDGMLVTSTIRDVSAGKQREAQLRKAEARYRSLVEEIPAVTFMAALDEGVNELYVSPQIVDLLGFTQQEWLDDPVLWHRQLHEEDRERWHIDFARTCATAQPFRSVYRFRARDGRVVWVHGEAKVVRDHDGRPMFLQGVAFDITERKEAEEELKQLNRTLEDRVADRTSALKRSNDALARYSHHVAHEMKKPLRRMFDVLDPPSNAATRDPLRKRLDEIRKIAGEMAELIKEMLAYAQVSEAAKTLVTINCAALCREVRTELQNEIETTEATVSFGPLPVVIGHRESLKTVFRNLIDNAIKYRARRRLKVKVGAERRAGEWLFHVRDNGMGIEKFNRYTPHINNWEKIFELFHRQSARDHQGAKIAGHGIGLSYCQRVIEHHGGKMWMESEPGKGSTFFFTLPAALKDERPAST